MVRENYKIQPSLPGHNRAGEKEPLKVSHALIGFVVLNFAVLVLSSAATSLRTAKERAIC